MARNAFALASAIVLVAACSSTGSTPGSSGAASAPGSAPASAGAGSSGGTTGGTIKIGGGFALTGDEAALDVPAANGAKLAVKQINAAGGVLGSQIDFIIHDSQYKPDVTAQTAKQFVEQDKVPVMIGYTDTDSVLAAGKPFQDAKIPFITIGATSPKIPTQVGDMMFLACFGDNVQAAVGAEYSYKTFGHNAYFLWDKGVEYTTLLGQYFKSRFTELGGTLALEDSYDDKASDFSAQITKIKALNPQPDFYYVAAMPYNIGPLVKQFRDAGITGPIVGGDGYDTPDLIKVAGAAADNVYFTTHALMDATGGTDGIKKFITDYKAEYGNDPENAFAALGYDTVYLMVDAIKRAGGTDSAAVKTAIEATKDFKGITGSITFSADSHVPQKGVTVIAVKGGKFTLGAEVVPEKVPAP
ncbi:MAG: branched-chain amino acid transport system substrate-binding protein [Chloroflexota bacterium]|jgi:branched-chain amino acid transport system substrate-binding protein|nr:branched-chain amino acid transport system substrate-binding protein [Chloroflexota bacterium]